MKLDCKWITICSTTSDITHQILFFIIQATECFLNVFRILVHFCIALKHTNIIYNKKLFEPIVGILFIWVLIPLFLILVKLISPNNVYVLYFILLDLVVENLQIIREPLVRFEAVYLINPSEESIDALIGDFFIRGYPMYKAAHIYFMQSEVFRYLN